MLRFTNAELNAFEHGASLEAPARVPVSHCCAFATAVVRRAIARVSARLRARCFPATIAQRRTSFHNRRASGR